MLPVEESDEQLAQRTRAKKLLLRGREYILRGLEIRRPGFRAALDKDGPEAALRLANKTDIDYLYWLGSSWMAAFSADPFDMNLIVTLPRAIVLLRQVKSWDGSYGGGAVDEILVTFYGSAPADLGGSEEKARESFRRAIDLSKGSKAGPYVSLASSVSVKNQNAAEFRELLGKALAIDLEASRSHRLENIISQRKARWMMEHIDLFFLEEGPG
jgi:predicted anti-sigma-YlaC factor YlaD